LCQLHCEVAKTLEESVLMQASGGWFSGLLHTNQNKLHEESEAACCTGQCPSAKFDNFLATKDWHCKHPISGAEICDLCDSAADLNLTLFGNCGIQN